MKDYLIKIFSFIEYYKKNQMVESHENQIIEFKNAIDEK